jgi:hypothetical protein
MKKNVLILSIILFSITAKLFGHGIHIEPEFKIPSVIVFSGYSETQPVAGATVTVFSPADASKPFQTGKTDKHGKFSFVPDIEGEWLFSVDDQKGHAEKSAINVPAAFINPQLEVPVIMKASQSETPATEEVHTHEDEMPLSFKIITGLSLIFGITGIYYGIKSKHTAGK